MTFSRLGLPANIIYKIAVTITTDSNLEQSGTNLITTTGSNLYIFQLEFSDLHDMTEGVLYELIYPPDRSELEKSFREITPKKHAGKRGGWVKVLPV